MQIKVDLGTFRDIRTDQLPNFYESLTALLPSLYNHCCNAGIPGGFLNEVQQGTSPAHVVEHLALEMQSLAGIQCCFGRTRETDRAGQYTVVFSYAEEEEGIFAARAAVAATKALLEGSLYPIEETIEKIQKLLYQDKLGVTTNSIVAEAAKRGIPSIRLDDSSYVQLGYGAKQRRIETALTNNTGLIATEIAGNKDVTKKILREAFVPVPSGVIIDCIVELKEAVQSVG
ncbi:MAG: cyanophycin synthetase, partial [Bacteroidota bacterium]|nr:cyanophycin synthetase [Bacteroidota bacterium]